MGTRFLVEPSAARYIVVAYFLQFNFQMTIIGDYIEKMEMYLSFLTLIIRVRLNENFIVTIKFLKLKISDYVDGDFLGNALLSEINIERSNVLISADLY